MITLSNHYRRLAKVFESFWMEAFVTSCNTEEFTLCHGGANVVVTALVLGLTAWCTNTSLLLFRKVERFPWRQYSTITNSGPEQAKKTR